MKKLVLTLSTLAFLSPAAMAEVQLIESSEYSEVIRENLYSNNDIGKSEMHKRIACKKMVKEKQTLVKNVFSSDSPVQVKMVFLPGNDRNFCIAEYTTNPEEAYFVTHTAYSNANVGNLKRWKLKSLCNSFKKRMEEDDRIFMLDGGWHKKESGFKKFSCDYKAFGIEFF